MDQRAHWNNVYRTRRPDQVSWFQAEAVLSRRLIEESVPDRRAAVLDVGAGASTLVDGLVAAGYHQLTVLDLSSAALATTQRRLGAAAIRVSWILADVLTGDLPYEAFDVWHDRAVFHFLTERADREAYLRQVRHAVKPGGLLVVATFAEDGPLRCSGLDVVRYSPTGLHSAFGDDFELLESHRELHTTPTGEQQAFTYCVCRFGPKVMTASW